MCAKILNLSNPFCIR